MINIFSPTLSFLGQIDNFSSCIIMRKYLGVETLEMTLPISYLSLLSPHNIISAGTNKVFEILHINVDTKDNMQVLKVIAHGFQKTLSKRMTYPPAGQAQHIVTNRVDTIVKTWIDANITNPADTNRKIDYIQIGGANNYGTSRTERTRYKNLWDEVQRVLSSVDAGCYFNLVNSKIVFQSYTGTDRTATNGVVPPVIFSTQYDNVIEQSYVNSKTDTKNLILVGGQGEGELRNIQTVGSSTGYERFEMFRDARDTDDNSELTQRGDSDYSDGIVSLECKINPNSNLIYEQDYFLGDKVSIKAPELGITVDKRITEIKEVYQANSPFGLEITFGQPLKTIFHSIKEANKNISGLSTI